MEKMTCFLNQALYKDYLDGKTGTQGGEKAHHLLHTGYKKLDVFVGDGPFLAALRSGLAAQVGLSAAVAQSIVPKTTPSSAAKSEIVLIDPYSDAVTLEVLSKKRPGVTVRLVCKNRGKPTPTEIAKFNRQYKGLTVTYSDDFHDRFLVIDNIELHGLGSSINCLGRRVTSYITRDAKEIARLLAMVP